MDKRASWASSAEARSRMRANRGRDTRPELALRRELHARGYRYFVNRRPLERLRRTADIVFPRTMVAVFVDGCFWHGCPEHHTTSRANADFWREKVETNRARDHETNERLNQAGWAVVRVWEHEDVGGAAAAVAEVVDGRLVRNRSRAGPRTARSATRRTEPAEPAL